MKAHFITFIRLFIYTAGIAIFSSCGSNSLYAPSASVTPEQTIAIAKAYCEYEWVPAQVHAFHGRDPDGILVHTPDKDYNQLSSKHRGWWQPARVNRGVPYKWGGFDTPATFEKKLTRYFYAGDSYTNEKRSLLEAGTSKYTCGIDCSGFVSRCWKLSRPYSTRELPSICQRLPSYNHLKAGDILNTRNGHVILFHKFANASKTRMHVFQAGAPPISRTERFTESVSYLKKQGFIPYRYKNMRPSNAVH